MFRHFLYEKYVYTLYWWIALKKNALSWNPGSAPDAVDDVPHFLYCPNVTDFWQTWLTGSKTYEILTMNDHHKKV